jgi:ribonuclease M5
MKVKIREAIVVEGRYDKNTLAQTVDAPIITLGGFGVFNDREKLAFLRRLAEKRGLIVLTDSDGAGFVIRNYLKGALPGDRVKQAYIPDIRGKERRKRRPGREGKLGVEGMSPAVLLEVLRRAGATFEDGSSGKDRPLEKDAAGTAETEKPLTKADLFALGLSGGAGSAVRRQALLKRLELPEHLNANGLLEALNLLYSREELEAALAALEEA